MGEIVNGVHRYCNCYRNNPADYPSNLEQGNAPDNVGDSQGNKSDVLGIKGVKE